MFFLQIQAPQASDDNSVLLWVVGALVAVVPVLFTFYIKATKDLKAAHELRVVDRDKQIVDLRNDLNEERKENARLKSEREKFLTDIKTSLDLQNQVTGSVATSMNEIKSVIIKMIER